MQDIAAGDTTVDVREVRFGDHALLDTSMLRFAAMGTTFTINWHIAELGTTFGGELRPPACRRPVRPKRGASAARRAGPS